MLTVDDASTGLVVRQSGAQVLSLRAGLDQKLKTTFTLSLTAASST